LTSSVVFVERILLELVLNGLNLIILLPVVLFGEGLAALALLPLYFVLLEHLFLAIRLVLLYILRQILPDLVVLLRLLLLHPWVLALPNCGQLILQVSQFVSFGGKLLFALLGVVGILIISVFAGAAQKSSLFLAVDRQFRFTLRLLFRPL
jgi:hypothetical protein